MRNPLSGFGKPFSAGMIIPADTLNILSISEAIRCNVSGSIPFSLKVVIADHRLQAAYE